jgi:hypothetical protein
MSVRAKPTSFNADEFRELEVCALRSYITRRSITNDQPRKTWRNYAVQDRHGDTHVIMYADFAQTTQVNRLVEMEISSRGVDRGAPYSACGGG